MSVATGGGPRYTSSGDSRRLWEVSQERDGRPLGQSSQAGACKGLGFVEQDLREKGWRLWDDPWTKGRDTDILAQISTWLV